MGRIQRRVSGDLITNTIVGAITMDELMDTLEKYHPGSTRYIMTDISKGSVKEISTDNLRRVATFLKDHTNEDSTRKIAIVAPDDLNYGIARSLQTLSEMKALSSQMHVFRTKSEALDWLNVSDLA